MNDIFKYINKATKDKRIKHSELRILLCLISYNSFKRIFPSLETISKDIGIKSIPDISKMLNNLHTFGYIEIKRRKHLSNIYKLNIVNSQTKDDKVKDKKKVSSPELSLQDKTQIFIDEINKATVETVAGVIAKANGRGRAESGDYAFVNSLLELKAKDLYKDDKFDKVRKCLIILYLVKLHYDKFKKDLPYAYFRVVYSSQIYKTVHSKIFNNYLKSEFPGVDELPEIRGRR